MSSNFANPLALPEDSIKQKIQSQVIQILNKTDYSLNVVNRYKENIVHASAANDCIDIIKCILQKHDKHCLERKNAFGWTPLMQAIRNENTEMVRFLLDAGAIVNDFSFLGLSVLSLACAISHEMFDLVFSSCPSALEYAVHDDIDPLCIAALKNDKKLFFKLIALGADVHKANALTHIMMKRSTVPEIVALAKPHLNAEDYWNDLSDIEHLLKEEDKNNNSYNNNANSTESPSDKLKNGISIPNICVNLSMDKDEEASQKNNNIPLNLLSCETKKSPKHLISPTFSYFNECAFPSSPNTFVTEDRSSTNCFDKHLLHVHGDENSVKDEIKSKTSSKESDDDDSSTLVTPLVLRRCQSKRPPNLKLRSSSNDSNATLSFTPQFSPTKTPNLPQDINEDNVFNETTPTPPKYKTPPRGIMLDPNTTKLLILLERFGLRRHIPIFLEQEVDLDLFFTLTDKDLIEIGIDSKSERLILLSVINECKGVKSQALPIL